MIKAKYYYSGEVVGTVKFSHDRNYQPNDVKDIISAAPKQWDSCCWDRGEVYKPAKKQKPKLTATLDLPVESTDSSDE